MYSDRQQAEMEKKLCVGNHKNCHLRFTRGISSEKKQTVPDEIEMCIRDSLQDVENQQHFV